MRSNEGVVKLDTLKEKVDSLEKRIDRVETKTELFSDKQSAFERRIEQKLDDKLTVYNQDMKSMIKDSDTKSRNRGQKLFSQTEEISRTLSEINVNLASISKDTESNSEDIKKIEESDKWKTRTIAGFVVAILLMVAGTLWDMIVGFPF